MTTIDNFGEYGVVLRQAGDMASSGHQDSELQHSFGPLEIGFDFLPLEASAAEAAPLPTRPGERVPMLDIQSSGPLVLPPESAAAPAADPSPPRTGRANGQQSGKQNGQPNGQKTSSPPAADRSPGTIWLDGDVIMCACPDCRAPLSVRVWLMVADCWRCGTTIELSEEQEREVQRLLDERQPAAPARPLPATEKLPQLQTAAPRVAPPAVAKPRFKSPPASAPAASPQPASAPAPSAPAARRVDPATPPRAPQPSAQPAPQRGPQQNPQVRPAAATARRPTGQRRRVVRQESWLKNLFRDTPAWLISLLVHLVALTLTALFTIEADEEGGPFITLSAMTALEKTPGGDVGKIDPDLLAKFDLPLPNKADLNDTRKREALLAANQDARELRLTDDSLPQLADVEKVKQLVGRSDGVGYAMAARDPRLRVEMVAKEGGTTLTEASVARGLRWLANHQNADGSWSLSGFHRAGHCNCNGDGAFSHKSPGTMLAMLPFLGAGQTHLVGKYQGNVSRGLRWMIEAQKENGDLRAGANDNAGMYTHGQGAIVLCEAYAMTGDEQLRIPAQKAIDFIVKAQYNDGGWRYQPQPRSQAGDTSVVGWQLMALQSARAANLTVPDQTLAMADQYLDRCAHRDGSQYSYQARGGPTPVMTAEGLLCRIYLGWKRDNDALGRGVEYLSSNYLPTASEPNIYFWYYGTQTMHHYGGPDWEEWNLRMRDVLVQSQETGGHAAGSWDPRGEHASAGGRIYMTALAICTLEVYYRHLPIFRQIELQ